MIVTGMLGEVEGTSLDSKIVQWQTANRERHWNEMTKITVPKRSRLDLRR